MRPTITFLVIAIPVLPLLSGTPMGASAPSVGADDPTQTQDVARARGVQDAVSSPDDDAEASGGGAQAPVQPSWGSLLVALPVVGGVAVAGWAMSRRRDPAEGTLAPEEETDPPDGEEPGADPGTRQAFPEEGSAPFPSPFQEDVEGAADEAGSDSPRRGLVTGGGLPWPDDVSEMDAGVPRLLRLGKEAVDEGNLEDAVDWFETAIAAEPDLPVAHLCRGLSLEELGEHEDAAEAFRATAERDPGHVGARYLLARSLAEAGQPREAIVHLRHVVDLVPELGNLARDDDGFSSLRDDPRFLAVVGEF